MAFEHRGTVERTAGKMDAMTDSKLRSFTIPRCLRAFSLAMLCAAPVLNGCGDDDESKKTSLHCCMLNRFCSNCPPSRCSSDDRSIAASGNDQACEEALSGGLGCELGNGNWYYSDHALAECAD